MPGRSLLRRTADCHVSCVQSEVFALLQPDKVRNAMDNFANAWKQDSWHPYRMPLPVLRLVVGGTGIGVAALFGYIAYVAFSR